MLHHADESQPARNSCPRLPHFVDSRFGLYHVAVVLSFLRSPALQKFDKKSARPYGVLFPLCIHWIVIYPVDSVIHPLNNWAVKFTKLFSTHNYFSYEQSFLPAYFVFKIKSIENSMEGQRSFRGFRSRNGSKLPNLSP